MTKATIEQLKERFVEAAINCCLQFLEGTDKQIFAAGAKLNLCYFELREHGDEGITALKELTRHERIEVRSMAAIKCQWIDTPFAICELRNVAKGADKHPLLTVERKAAFSAESVYGVLKIRQGVPVSEDPYIKWKRNG